MQQCSTQMSPLKLCLSICSVIMYIKATEIFYLDNRINTKAPLPRDCLYPGEVARHPREPRGRARLAASPRPEAGHAD